MSVNCTEGMIPEPVSSSGEGMASLIVRTIEVGVASLQISPSK